MTARPAADETEPGVATSGSSTLSVLSRLHAVAAMATRASPVIPATRPKRDEINFVVIVIYGSEGQVNARGPKAKRRLRQEIELREAARARIHFRIEALVLGPRLQVAARERDR